MSAVETPTVAKRRGVRWRKPGLKRREAIVYIDKEQTEKVSYCKRLGLKATGANGAEVELILMSSHWTVQPRARRVNNFISTPFHTTQVNE